MVQFNDLAIENNINLDECVIFVKDNNQVLAVNTRNVGIKQRQDDTMGVNFKRLLLNQMIHILNLHVNAVNFATLNEVIINAKFFNFK